MGRTTGTPKFVGKKTRPGGGIRVSNVQKGKSKQLSTGGSR